MNPNIEHYRDVQSMQFDADSAQFGRNKEQRQDVLSARHAEFKADFYRMFLKSPAESMDGLMVAQCLEPNLSGADMHALLLCIIKGDFAEASKLTREHLDVAAKYFADNEVIQS